MSCGAGAPKWSGRCGQCGDWNTLSEELEVADPAPVPLAPSSPPVPITELGPAEGRPVPSGIDEPIRITPAIKRQLRGVKGSAGQQSADMNIAFKSGARTHSPEDITLRIRVNILIHQ